MAVGLFDIFLFMVLIAGMALGMFRGILRQAISVVILYVAVVLAALSYVWFAGRIAWMAGNPDALNHSAAFIILLVLLAGGLEGAVQKTYPKLEWRWMGGLNQLGGMVTGFLWAAVCTTFILMALSFAVNAGDWGPIEGTRRMLFEASDRSALANIYRSAFPVLAQSLDPFFPGGLPPLFVPPPI
jgi:hypothetical protein